jgi:hypothetical protein
VERGVVKDYHRFLDATVSIGLSYGTHPGAIQSGHDEISWSGYFQVIRALLTIRPGL